MALDDLVGTQIQDAMYRPPTGNQGAFTQNGPMGNFNSGGGILRTIGPEDQLGLENLLSRK